VNARARFVALLPAAAVFAAFAPALSASFVSWDDPFLIIENPWIRGLSGPHLRWMVEAVQGGIWQPVTWLSLACDYALWGLEPAGFHMTNVMIHAATSTLFYLVCLRLLDGRRGAALLAALFFALHPLRVESVAWASERKGLLSGFFCMAAVLAHLHGRSRAAAAAFALSLMSKASSLPLPFALLALDHLLKRRRSWRGLAPMFVLSAGALLVGMLAGRSAGAVTDMPLAWTLSRAAHGLLFYPFRTLWPSGLSPYYPPLRSFGHLSWELLALAGLAAAVWTWGRRRREVLAALAWFGLMLLPMLGLVQHGIAYAAADRFSYLPCLAFAVLFGAALARSRAGTAVAAAWLLALGAASWRQSAVWRDSVSLWTAATERAPGTIARGELAAALLAAGRTGEGVALLREASAEPGAPSTLHVNLGSALRKGGDEEGARDVWRRGLAAAPSAELEALLGASLSRTDIKASTTLLRSAALSEPSRASWRADLGDALALGGRRTEAKREYETALALEPALGRAHNNLGLLLEGPERVEHYRAALRDPLSRAEAHHNWGNAHLDAGRTADAERHYRAALRLAPALARAQVNLGNILARRGDYPQAAALYRAALKNEPRSVEARANLTAVASRLRR